MPSEVEIKKDGTLKYDQEQVEIKNSVETEQIYGLVDYYSAGEVLTNKVWIDGKHIYREVVDFGALPSSGNKFVDMTVSSSLIDEIVELRAIWDNGTEAIQNNRARTQSGSEWHMYWSINAGRVKANTYSEDLSGYTAKVVVEYTRTDK